MEETRIIISGKEYIVDEICNYNNDYFPLIITSNEEEFYLSKDADFSFSRMVEYIKDFILNDPTEFNLIFNDDFYLDVISALLKDENKTFKEAFENRIEWYSIAKEFAGYDFKTRDVTFSSKDLIDAIGFNPTIAYRRS